MYNFHSQVVQYGCWSSSHHHILIPSSNPEEERAERSHHELLRFRRTCQNILFVGQNLDTWLYLDARIAEKYSLLAGQQWLLFKSLGFCF